MTPKEKVGDIVIPSSNIDQLMDMVKRHYKKIDNEKKGKREMREIQQIFRGTLREFPEYIERMRRKKEKEAQSMMGKTSRKTLHTNTSHTKFPASARNNSLPAQSSHSTFHKNNQAKFRRASVNVNSKIGGRNEE